MREIKRKIARHMMELAGIEHINRKMTTVDARGKVEKHSYFAKHWKAYMDPGSDERKTLHAKLRAKEARRKQLDPTYRPVLKPWPLKP